ncbi:MAG: S41 family peptidase [Gemmatimonadaceae bacterium]
MRSFLALALVWSFAAPPADPNVKLVRYPTYSQGRIAFTYLGDIWIADETGKNAQRLTVNTARDVFPHFSPDGKSIAFSSDRDGNNDVFIIPSTGGEPKQLTHHSAGDEVLGWTPDGKSVVFASNRGDDFAGKLYTVSVNGGMPKTVGVDYGVWGSYSPDGKKFAYNRRTQVYWRKYYRGAANSDVTIMDIDSKKFTDVTDYTGEDSWPMYGADGRIFFVSDRDGNGLTNIWRVSDKGGAAEKVTKYTSGDVRWPTMSADGKTIVFEHDFGISRLDVATGQITAIPISISAETQANGAEVRSFTSQADDYDLAPSGKRIAVVTRGEIFTVPVDETGGDVTQVTDSPWRDQNPSYSPDGKWIAYVSDQSGREEIWLASADGAGAARKLTTVDALKNAISWSPDSKQIAYSASDSKVRVIAVEGAANVDLSTSRYGNIGGMSWSPDGKWIAFTKPDVTRTSDVYLIPSGGGAEKRVTFESYQESNPHFSPDGKKVFFTRNTGGGGGRGGGAGNGSSQVWALTLDREDRDPNDVADAADATSGSAASHDTKVDWNNLERRTRQVTRLAYGVQSYTVAPNGSLAVLTSEPTGTRNIPTVYSISADGKRSSRIVSGAATGGDDEAAPPDGGGRGGAGGGITDMTFSRDGRALFYRSGQGVFTVAVGGGGTPGGRGAANAAVAGNATGRRIAYATRVRIDQRAEWEEMFGDAWRTMKYRFYDANMHGKNWDAMKAKYEPMVAYVGDRQELLNIINEMIGELDASHTGAAPAPGARANAVQTRHLGVELTQDDAAGRYKITHVFKNGPADHDWVKANVGDYLIAIDGQPVKAGDEYYTLLNHPLNKKVEVTLSSKGTAEGAWKTKIEPVSQGEFGNLRYERWVADERAQVEKATEGRIGYVHIKAMDQPSLVRFEKEVRENRDKEALVIDQRWNGGGNIEQELLAVLIQRQYQVWQPRGTDETTRPLQGFFGPKIVLQNWRSASNAEMFPAGFKALGLGKTVGNPTMGAVIGTGSYSMIDGSTVRTPGTGVYLNDEKHTNMEHYGVPPDIYVENRPEDMLAGRDKQLEAAIEQLKKELPAKKRAAM